MLPASVLPGRAVLAYPRTITNQPRIKGEIGGKTYFSCSICDTEATYLTADYHFCSDCFATYPPGSEALHQALDDADHGWG
ncbi:hypothetical protein [Nocardia sp. NRRL WC-3656]|uniref:hypothetical protein n=1 Tax=Nocardia sp. NRRL WC-3656 TaxID=1463824 RepID=UPI0004C4002E|nr:hypothetical protein [Nocardia sp. NRRL WC-3656]